jgi:hypothetical protein
MKNILKIIFFIFENYFNGYARFGHPPTHKRPHSDKTMRKTLQIMTPEDNASTQQ